MQHGLQPCDTVYNPGELAYLLNETPINLTLSYRHHGCLITKSHALHLTGD